MSNDDCAVVTALPRKKLALAKIEDSDGVLKFINEKELQPENIQTIIFDANLKSDWRVFYWEDAEPTEDWKAKYEALEKEHAELQRNYAYVEANAEFEIDWRDKRIEELHDMLDRANSELGASTFNY